MPEPCHLALADVDERLAELGDASHGERPMLLRARARALRPARPVDYPPAAA